MHKCARSGMCTECEEEGVWCDYYIELHTGVGYAQHMFNMHMCKACAYEYIAENCKVSSNVTDDELKISPERAEVVRKFYSRLREWMCLNWQCVDV
jgi:hypothetical protein